MPEEASAPTPAPSVRRVLLVDADAERAAFVTDVLKGAGIASVFRFDDASDLLDKVLQLKPDLVLVEVDSPKRDVLEQLTGVTRRLPVVLVAQDRSPEAIRAAMDRGVSSYVVEGLAPDSATAALDVATATFARFAALQKELDQAKTQIAHRRTVEDAKRLLITQRGCDEPAAYRTLQKLAMDGNRRIIEVARDLLKYAEVLGGAPPKA